MNSPRRRIDVVAGIIERSSALLLARRDDIRDQPGLWELPGGKVEAGETQPQALVRELREELCELGAMSRASNGSSPIVK